MFKHTEKEVTRQPWYQSGFRANIVAYAISRVASEVQKNNCHVDFKQIWKDQDVSDEMSAALMVAAQAATDIIHDAPPEVKNPTEWAKKEACWQRLAERKLEFPELWYYELLSDEEQNERIEEAKENAAIESEISIYDLLVEWPTEHWRSLLAFARNKRLIKSFDENSLKAAISFADTQTALPNDRQFKAIAKVLQNSRSLGWEPNN